MSERDQTKLGKPRTQKKQNDATEHRYTYMTPCSSGFSDSLTPQRKRLVGVLRPMRSPLLHESPLDPPVVRLVFRIVYKDALDDLHHLLARVRPPPAEVLDILLRTPA